MAVIHIPEEEAAKTLSDLIKRVRLGEEFVIDGSNSSARLVADIPRGRTAAEMIAILDKLPGEREVMDEDFARDVRSFRERHSGESLGAKWE